MILMEFDRIDHVVFTVRDIAATCDFYVRALGLRVLTFDDGRRALQVGQCKINLHQQGHEFEPKALRPGPGTQDICLVTTTPLHEVISHLRAVGIAIVEGPVPRTGARGTMESVYVRDPDGNLVEVARYPEGGS
jgi:catechol 2,3-dioxygenase-like lactoylglutathione lyase family enzyme